MNPISRAIAVIGRVLKANPPLQGVDARGGWWPVVHESFTGAWQQGVEVRQDLVMANWTVFACMTLIAGDIGKLRLQLVEQDSLGIWSETTNPAFSPVLRRPNRYQIRQKFIESWILSKLGAGNAYILKERDARNVVVALYVLDSQRVTPMVAPDGAVYYQLQDDLLAQVPMGLPAVPASEIIHDRAWCLFHPLVGLSPLYACALAATQALKIQTYSEKLFANMARPSGILTAPAQISEETAKRIKEHWERNYGVDNPANIGKVAVLGDGLKYEGMTMNSVDAELVKQLEMTAPMICATFHVPPHMVAAAAVPPVNNVEALETAYYSKALQPLIESIEALLDDGLGLAAPIAGRQLGTYFDLDDLLRMDQKTLMETLGVGVDKAILAPNNARRRLNYGPVDGGDSPMIQQQNYSLAALAKRDAGPDPFGKAPAAAPKTDMPADDSAAEEAREFIAHIMKGLECAPN